MADLLTTAQVAQALRRTPRRIQQLVKEGMPQEGRGRFDFNKAAVWYLFYLQDRLDEREATEVDEESAEARLRFDRARATRAEVELAKMMSELLTVTSWRDTLDGALGRVASKLRALGNRLAPAVVGTVDIQDAVARVTPLITEVMDELYRSEDVPGRPVPPRSASALRRTGDRHGRHRDHGGGRPRSGANPHAADPLAG